MWMLVGYCRDKQMQRRRPCWTICQDRCFLPRRSDAAPAAIRDIGNIGDSAHGTVRHGQQQYKQCAEQEYLYSGRKATVIFAELQP